MSDQLRASLVTSASGLHAQSVRMRILSENLANANSTSNVPGGDPYQRKTVSFAEELERVSGAGTVRVNPFGRDETPFPVEKNPSHPAADENGMVKLPNVNPLVEMTDMRQANRSYEANLQVIRQAREMIADLIDLLRGK